MRVPTLTRSAWALVAANLVPLAGVLLLGWDLGAIMLLFWAENVVVGVFHALRIALVAGWAGLFFVPFFAFHYGMFTLVHGVFVVMLFVAGPFTEAERGPLDALRAHAGVLLLGIAALFASHGYSFVTNFLRGGERERMWSAVRSLRFRKTGRGQWAAELSEQDLADPARLGGLREVGDLMTAPYRRIAVLHLTILVGGAVMLFLRAPAAALVVLVALKTGMDLRAHLAERERLGQVRAPPDATPN